MTSAETCSCGDGRGQEHGPRCELARRAVSGRRPGVVCAAALGALLLTIILAPSAHAAQSWKLTYNPTGPGSIMAKGQVTFADKHKVTWWMNAVDYCGPGGAGDGKGVAARPVYKMPHGINEVSGWRKNTDGCGESKWFNGSYGPTAEILPITHMYWQLGVVSPSGAVRS